jgi:hypothetical protein
VKHEITFYSRSMRSRDRRAKYRYLNTPVF